MIELLIAAPHIKASLPAGTLLSADNIEMRPVPLRFVESTGFPQLDDVVGNWWSGSESDVLSRFHGCAATDPRLLRPYSTRPPRREAPKLMSEGATGTFFETRIALANPSAVDDASAVVRFDKADGTSVSWYKRDPQLAKDLLQRSIAIHTRLAKEWPRLADEYRQALPDLVSPESWHRTFEASRH